MPREFRRRWNGHVGIDATPIRAYSGYDHCTFTTKNGKTVVDKIITKAPDATAGPYNRDADHRDPASPDAKPGRKVKKAMYAHEASLVIMGPDAPNDDDGTFPYLFTAMAPLHRPGADPGGKALLVSGHYDSVATSFGATDCAMCTVTVLETLRAVVDAADAGQPLRNDVIFLFTDAEEIGVAGAATSAAVTV